MKISTMILSVFALSICEAQPQFPAVFKDLSNGVSWSKTLPGEYGNGCFLSQSLECLFQKDPATGELAKDSEGNRLVEPDDSQASLACKKLNGRLPTVAEAKSLFKQFPHKDSTCFDYNNSTGEFADCVVFYGRGYASFASVFGDEDKSFWTSSVRKDLDSAFVYSPHPSNPNIYKRSRSSPFQPLNNGINTNSVRCVTEQ